MFGELCFKNTFSSIPLLQFARNVSVVNRYVTLDKNRLFCFFSRKKRTINISARRS